MNEEQLKQLSCSQEQQGALRKEITQQSNAQGKGISVRTLTKKLDLFRTALDLGIDLAQYTSVHGARSSSDATPPSPDAKVAPATHRPIDQIEADISNASEEHRKALESLSKVEAIEGIDQSIIDATKATADKREQDVKKLIVERDDAKKAEELARQQAQASLTVQCPTVQDIDWQPAKKVFGVRLKTLDGVLCPVYVGNDPTVLKEVPKIDPNFFFSYENGEVLKDILIAFGAVYKSQPKNSTTWIWGQRGAGKSDLVAQISARLNRPLFVTSCHRELTVEQLGGEFDPRSVAQGQSAPVVLDPVFVEGIQTPHAICVFDELARVTPTNAVGMNGTLENRVLARIDGSTIPFAEGVTITATDNTDGTGDATGQFQAYPQDESFLDRFRTTIEVPFLPSAEEAKVLIAKEGICAPVAKLIVKLMNAFRGASNGAGGHQARSLYPSLRGGFILAFSLREGKSFRRAVHQNLIGNAIPSDREIANVLIETICPKDEEVAEVLAGVKSDFTS